MLLWTGVTIDFRRIVWHSPVAKLDFSAFEKVSLIGESPQLSRRLDDAPQVFVKSFHLSEFVNETAVEKEIALLLNLRQPAIATPFGSVLLAWWNQRLGDCLAMAVLWWKSFACAGLGDADADGASEGDCGDSTRPSLCPPLRAAARGRASSSCPVRRRARGANRGLQSRPARARGGGWLFW
jgi:hypothetical protein